LRSDGTMSRASYIYAICECGEALAVFTVKHKMMTALRKHYAGKFGIRVWRYRDGAIDTPENISLEKAIAEVLG
jgi:hypothetical protein